MNPSQREAIQKFTKEIIDTCGITIQVFLDNLMQHQVLSWEERELVNSQMTNSSKMLLVLRMLHVKDNGWDVIVRFLRENGYRRLAESLEEEVNPPAPVPEPNK